MGGWVGGLGGVERGDWDELLESMGGWMGWVEEKEAV